MFSIYPSYNRLIGIASREFLLNTANYRVFDLNFLILIFQRRTIYRISKKKTQKPGI